MELPTVLCVLPQLGQELEPQEGADGAEAAEVAKTRPRTTTKTRLNGGTDERRVPVGRDWQVVGHCDRNCDYW